LFLGSRQDLSVYSPGINSNNNYKYAIINLKIVSKCLTGGVGIMDDGTNGLIFYYQYLNTSIGYPYPQLQWGYNTVVFANGWPILQ
jgi:hypothetical protein